MLARRLRLRDRDGRITRAAGRRLVHMGQAHLASLAGTVDILTRRHAGLRVHHGQLALRPALPHHRLGLERRIQRQGTSLRGELEPGVRRELHPAGSSG